MINFVNLDGGMLGKSTLLNEVITFPVIVLRVAHTLKDLKKTLDEHKWEDTVPSYAFEFSDVHKDMVTVSMMHLEPLLPKGVNWYETDGKRLFEKRSYSGGLATTLVCYLICKE